MNTITRNLVKAAAGAAALTMAFAAPASATVRPLDSGGGCANSSVQSGYQYRVCVSTSGGKVHTDAYQLRLGTRPSGCTVRVWTEDLDATDGWVGDDYLDYPCTTSHPTGPDITKRSGWEYRTEVIVYTANTRLFSSVSPIQHT